MKTNLPLNLKRDLACGGLVIGLGRANLCKHLIVYQKSLLNHP
jgi:hypothetical protein